MDHTQDLTYTMAPRERKKILALGVSYANLEAQLKSLGASVTDLEESDDNVPSLSSSASPALRNTIHSVSHGLMTQMDGRDLARIVETERVCKVDVYAVSNEKGAVYRPDRHYSGDFCNRKFVDSLKDQFPGVVFHQVILDYFWIPTGWDRQHWSRSLFENTLVSFAKMDVLKPDAKIYLPFCLHCLKEVLICQGSLLEHYNISFLRKKGLKEIDFWRGTQSIDPKAMQHVLGKRIDQEEVYCTFGSRTVLGDEANSFITHDDIAQFCRQLEDFSSIRFIVLQALPRPVQNKTRRQQELSAAKGQILGLTRPDRVKNGFDNAHTAPAKVATTQSSRKRVTAEGRKAPTKRRITISPASSQS